MLVLLASKVLLVMFEVVVACFVGYWLVGTSDGRKDTGLLVPVVMAVMLDVFICRFSSLSI